MMNNEQAKFQCGMRCMKQVSVGRKMEMCKKNEVILGCHEFRKNI